MTIVAAVQDFHLRMEAMVKRGAVKGVSLEIGDSPPIIWGDMTEGSDETPATELP